MLFDEITRKRPTNPHYPHLFFRSCYPLNPSHNASWVDYPSCDGEESLDDVGNHPCDVAVHDLSLAMGIHLYGLGQNDYGEGSYVEGEDDGKEDYHLDCDEGQGNRRV